MNHAQDFDCRMAVFNAKLDKHVDSQMKGRCAAGCEFCEAIASVHIHGIYPPALEKLAADEQRPLEPRFAEILHKHRQRLYLRDSAPEPKPFLWSDKKHVKEVTWIVVLGVATVMAVALLSAGVWCAQKLGVLG